MRRAAGLLAAAAILYVVLAQPNHPGAMTWGALTLVPQELPLILAALVALPGGAVAATIRAALVLMLTASAVLKAADAATYVAFGRSFDVMVDLPLVVSAWQLGRGTLGLPLALLAAGALILTVLILVLALWWATGRWTALTLPRRGRRMWLASCGAVIAASVAVMVVQIGMVRGTIDPPMNPPGAAFTTRLGIERVTEARKTARQLAAFREAARTDPLAGTGPLFDRLDGHDILLTFVESYGRASFDNPLYSGTHVGTLERYESRLRDAGLAMRSGYLRSPVRGGQSWLAHATLASGLTISDQTRYRALLASDRRGLPHLARAGGRHTAAVMPAITLDWPEVEHMGFDTVLVAESLGYRGPPFNWVTMPDQFTLAAMDRRLRSGPTAPAAPLLAEIALISSHAPWTPVPELVPWENVGDGSVFARWANAGDPPEIVWQDHDRVRDQYRKAIDYALQSILSYADTRADPRPLIVVLGDHQPAGFVAQSDSYDVPVHLIGPPDVVALFDAWDWQEGLVPRDDVRVWPMAAFRDRFVGALSSGLSP
ncbi:hypothetical protein SAMN04490244_111105 [Tranquillimonas rosea]|uniref:Phosphoglycerol transferase MdoB n=1 Tax=Tranquillimonas rosea TaxID=641238 RepID=A0A1H9WLP4_9RHOB|nr:sulfatase [Tranquillimonas rosea]SES34741.1 hypothetical protein SAMN04490244_111105 [Tranquillimonas rosea]